MPWQHGRTKPGLNIAQNVNARLHGNADGAPRGGFIVFPIGGGRATAPRPELAQEYSSRNNLTKMREKNNPKNTTVAINIIPREKRMHISFSIIIFNERNYLFRQ